ncbi:MAG: CDP-diacylglycerol--serine O-phosphatidyltransferase [Hyphomicrobiales bacterium]
MTDLFPPFEPEREPETKRFRAVPLRVLLPNLITLLSLGSGLTAMRLVIEGHVQSALIAILIAAVLDALDGRIARLLKGTSRFGAELDSLSDFVSFGVAPAIILYTVSLHHLKSFGWIVVLLFACASALRLARFNVMIDDPDRPDWQKNFFVGIPAPAGALVLLLPMYVRVLGFDPPDGFVAIEAAFTLFVAFMMVSRIPTYAGKTLGSRVPRTWVMPLFVAVVAFVAILVTFTFEVLTVCTIFYLLLIPVGFRRYRLMALQEPKLP